MNPKASSPHPNAVDGLARRIAGAFLLLALSSGRGAVTNAPASARRPDPSPRPAASSGLKTNGPPSLAGFRVPPGFRVDVVAAEPLLTEPIALAFDERGRAFVLEGAESPAMETGLGAKGRVRLLGEPDDQGVFQTSAVYVDNLPHPSALACYHGGVFIAAAPDILYAKDTHDDGRADVRVTALNGFATPTNSYHPPALPNNFNWGMDHLIHAAGGGLDGLLLAPSAAVARPVPLRGRDFAFDPRTLAVVVEAGPSESGLSFDSAGRKFACAPSHALRQPLFEPRYYDRAPFFPSAPGMVDVAEPATRVFRWDPSQVASSSEERTAGPGAPAPAWLTDARGCVIYRGGAFPTNYWDNAFIADPDGHLIHHLVLRENGLTMDASRPSAERAREFLVSTDRSFRPTQLVNGPDGALYVVDHRLNPGEGRIYRIAPVSFQPAPPRRWDKASIRELVTALAQTNGWVVDTAARLLYERQDRAAVDLLTNMFLHARLPLARLRALHALEAQGALGMGYVDRALTDPDPRVREHALVLMERLAPDGHVSPSVWEHLAPLSQDPSPRVRYQLALSVGALRHQAKYPILASLLGRDLDSLWMRGAVLGSASDDPSVFLARLSMNPGFRGLPGAWSWLEDAAAMVGLRGRMDEVTHLLEYVGQDSLPAAQSMLLLSALGEGVHRTQSSLGMVDPEARLLNFYRAALLAAANDNAGLPARLAGARLLAVAPFSYTNASDWLRVVLSPAEPPVLQSAALIALGRYPHPRMGLDLLQGWRSLTPNLRSQAVAALLARAERANFVLDALVAGRIARDDLTSTQANFLRTHRDPVISARAREILGPFRAERPAVLQRFRDAVRLPGLASRGRAVFLDRCAGCHQLAGEGWSFGPDLTGVKVQGRERILGAILEPSLDLAPAYATLVVETKIGEVLVGLKTGEGPGTITLREPGHPAAVWATDGLISGETQPWSLMPSGLEQGLEVQDMADLLEYLTADPPAPR